MGLSGGKLHRTTYNSGETWKPGESAFGEPLKPTGGIGGWGQDYSSCAGRQITARPPEMDTYLTLMDCLPGS